MEQQKIQDQLQKAQELCALASAQVQKSKEILAKAAESEAKGEPLPADSVKWLSWVVDGYLRAMNQRMQKKWADWQKDHPNPLEESHKALKKRARRIVRL